MLPTEKALKVSVYLTEGSTHKGIPCETGIVDFLFFRGVGGATVLKGVAGFGSDHRMHSQSHIAISDKLPIKIEFIETPEKVEEILPKLKDLASTGIIEIHETSIIRPTHAASEPVEAALTHHKVQGAAKLLRIYIGEEDRWHDRPLHHALVEALRANDIAGVTVYKGILGFGEHREIHEQHAMANGASLMLSVIDAEDRIRAFMPILDRMLPNGLAVLSDVDVITYRYADNPQGGPAEDGHHA